MSAVPHLDEAARVAHLMVEHLRAAGSVDLRAAFLHVCATTPVNLPGLEIAP